jgi:multidrug efflux pump subunit AcrA (membrane-fusion protein)
MKKKIIITIALVALIVSGFLFFGGTDTTDANEVTVPVTSGPFIIDVVTSGELQAKNSVEILGPTSLRDFRIYNVTIQSIVEEGKEVKKGDWIATLDKSEFQTRRQDKEIELEQKNSEYIQTQLDTTLQMRQARDELINLAYAVEEMKLKLEQSRYEPPATIKQAEIDMDKAKRAYDQAVENYQIKLKQNKTKMQIIASKLRKEQREYDAIIDLEKSFIIKAPEDGMVIYTKGWDGKQVKQGSQISTWSPVVATLPDLSTMLSKTYVNEVDVRRIKSDQPVDIGLDAFPDKLLKGSVTRVANVGEQRPNSDSKVFETNIEVQQSDPLLKPGMTTSNRIIVQVYDSALHIPLECLHSQADSITYVYKKAGLNIEKQEVQVGATNANEAIILKGLEQNDRVYLSIPRSANEKEIALLPELNGTRMKKEEEQEQEKMRTITLPDGSTREVTEEQYEKYEEMRKKRQAGTQATKPNS